MPLPLNGQPIDVEDLQTEFGGSNPIGIDEYYAGGLYVPSDIVGIPTAGAIGLSDFYEFEVPIEFAIGEKMQEYLGPGTSIGTKQSATYNVPRYTPNATYRATMRMDAVAQYDFNYGWFAITKNGVSLNQLRLGGSGDLSSWADSWFRYNSGSRTVTYDFVAASQDQFTFQTYLGTRLQQTSSLIHTHFSTKVERIA